MAKAYSKGAKLKAKKAAKANPLGLPEVGSPLAREPNGRSQRETNDRGADKAVLKARCRQRGVAANAANMRDSRSPWWGCNAGRAMAGAVESHGERLELWDAIQHMRRVVTAYDAAIGAPRRHAVCLRLLVPIEEMSADASTPPADERTPEERQVVAVSAYMALEGWLGWTDKAAMGEAKRAVWDDFEVKDVAGLLSALRCVVDGMKARRMVFRGRA